MSTYDDVIARKSASPLASGLTDADIDLAPHLFGHQTDLVRWALRRGRAALFADTGLGKGPMAIEWARNVAKRGRVLVLAPLAVGPQLSREAARFAVHAPYLRADDPDLPIVVTNYEMLHAFDPEAFTGVVLDESSILKAFNGKTRTRLIDAFRETPFKLACTATPAPNDFTELGNHAEFLGIKSRTEMLAEYFVHDGGSTQDWHLKGHAVIPFWRWVATWGAVIRMPSDLGYEDGAFKLPPLTMREHIVTSPHDHRATGNLFADDARTLAEQRAARRATIDARAEKVAELVHAHNGCDVVWCELNDEQDACAEALGDNAVSIAGKTPDDEKIALHEAWLKGEVKTLVTKGSLFGFGLNWQHCNHQVFAGPSNSYERTYQSVRRCWRFGQTREVLIDVVRSDQDGAIVENFRAKEADAARMAREMAVHVREVVRAEVQGLRREFNPYQPAAPMAIPSWLGGSQ
jgi:superfamily II DNA or RNA helicase